MSTVSSTRTGLALNRPLAVVAIVVGALIVNLVLWLIGAAAGGTFEFVDNGELFDAAPGGVITLTAVPLIVGTGLAALISLKWVAVIRVAQVIGALAALGTIAMTLDANFDGASTVTLSLMHVAIAVILVVGLEAMRRPLVRPTV